MQPKKPSYKEFEEYNFNLLFEAIFYATRISEMNHLKDLRNFNLLFEAIFYATSTNTITELIDQRIFQSSI